MGPKTVKSGLTNDIKAHFVYYRTLTIINESCRLKIGSVGHYWYILLCYLTSTSATGNLLLVSSYFYSTGSTLRNIVQYFN